LKIPLGVLDYSAATLPQSAVEMSKSCLQNNSEMENVYPPKYEEFINISKDTEQFKANLLQIEAEGIPQSNEALKRKLNFDG
jgi:hypothetical protein